MIWLVLLSVLISMTFLFLLAQRLCRAWLAKWEMRIKTDTVASLRDFFLFIDPSVLWSTTIMLSLALAGLAWLASGSWWLAVPASVLGGFAPAQLVARMRKKRLAMFDRQLPDMLLALAGALRAGAGVHAALRQIANEAPAPLSQEFGLLYRQQRLGVSFEQSLDQLHLRMPTDSTGLFVSALQIAGRSGGSLAEALERIAETLQARLQIQSRIRALTAQGKMQAWVMAALPFVLMLALCFLDADSMRMMWSSPAGWLVLLILFLLEALGLWLILKIVNIDV